MIVEMRKAEKQTNQTKTEVDQTKETEQTKKETDQTEKETDQTRDQREKAWFRPAIPSESTPAQKEEDEPQIDRMTIKASINKQLMKRERPVGNLYWCARLTLLEGLYC
jgi:seryl-tRNA synthetase